MNENLQAGKMSSQFEDAENPDEFERVEKDEQMVAS